MVSRSKAREIVTTSVTAEAAATRANQLKAIIQKRRPGPKPKDKPETKCCEVINGKRCKEPRSGKPGKSWALRCNKHERERRLANTAAKVTAGEKIDTQCKHVDEITGVKCAVDKYEFSSYCTPHIEAHRIINARFKEEGKLQAPDPQCCSLDHSTGERCLKAKQGGYLRCGVHLKEYTLRNRELKNIPVQKCVEVDDITGLQCMNPRYNLMRRCRAHVQERKKPRTVELDDARKQYHEYLEYQIMEGSATNEELEELQCMNEILDALAERERNRSKMQSIIGRACIQLDQTHALKIQLSDAIVVDYDHIDPATKTAGVSQIARYGLSMRLVQEISLCNPVHVFIHRTRNVADAKRKPPGSEVHPRERFRDQMRNYKREIDECAYCQISISSGQIEPFHLEFAHNVKLMEEKGIDKALDKNGRTIDPSMLHTIGHFNSQVVQDQLSVCKLLCTPCHRRETDRERKTDVRAIEFAEHLQSYPLIVLQLKQLFDRTEPRLTMEQKTVMVPQLRARLALKFLSWIVSIRGSTHPLNKTALSNRSVAAMISSLRVAKVPFQMINVYDVYCQYRVQQGLEFIDVTDSDPEPTDIQILPQEEDEIDYD